MSRGGLLKMSLLLFMAWLYAGKSAQLPRCPAFVCCDGSGLGSTSGRQMSSVVFLHPHHFKTTKRRNETTTPDPLKDLRLKTNHCSNHQYYRNLLGLIFLIISSHFCLHSCITHLFKITHNKYQLCSHSAPQLLTGGVVTNFLIL